MKRKVALAFAVTVVALAAAALVGVRTPWAGERLCAFAEARVRRAAGLELSLAECRVEPFLLEVRARAVRIGPAAAPVFEADAVRARLAPVQPLGRQLELAELEVTRPRVTARWPEPAPGRPATCPPPALRQFQIDRLEVDGGALDLALPGGRRLTVERVDVRSAPVRARRGLAALAAPGVRRAGLELELSRARLLGGGPPVEVREARAAADLALDLSRLDLHVAQAALPGVELAAAGVVEELCRPRLDLAASASGELGALVALLGRPRLPAEGRFAVDAAVTGPAAEPTASGEVRLERAVLDGWRPGDATARLRLAGRELRVERLDLPTAGGRVAAQGVLRFGREVRLDAEASLEQVELGELLGRLQLPGAWVMARIGGKVRVTGTAAPLQLAGEAALELGGFRVLDHAWERWRPGEDTYLDLERARVDGPVRIDRGGVHLEGVRVRAGAGAVAVRGALHFEDAGGFELAVDGAADLGELRHVAGAPIGGLAQLDGVAVRAAPYGVPRVAGRARVRDLRFLRLDLGEAEAAVSFEQPLLRAAGVQGRRGATTYQGELAVALADGPPRVTEGRFTLQGRVRDALEAVMPWLPAAVHVRDVLDGDLHARGALGGPAAALDAAVEADLGAGALAGRAFEGGRFVARVEKGARVVVDEAVLRRGAGAARASGHVGLAPPFPWDLRGAFQGVALTDLTLPGRGWGGTVEGSATLRGSWEDPALDLSARGAGITTYDLVAGPVRADVRLRGRRLEVTGETPGVRFTGTARTDGELPFEARTDLDAADAMRFFPGGPPAGLRASVRGAGSARGSLRDLAGARAEVRLREVSVGYGEFEVEQAAPVVLAAEEGRLLVRELALRGANTQFSLTGARERSGALGLDARGALDLRLLGGLLPGVNEPRGQLRLEAHVGGTLSEPVLVGTGRLREAGFRIRDAPVTFGGVAGDLAFSQNRVLFDRLDAAVNGGRATLSGEAELVRLAPSRVRVSALVEEVPLRLPEWLPTVVSGRLQATGTFDAMLLSGKLHVLRALYAEPVDLERRLLEVPGRRPAPRPFDRAGEWLGLDVVLVVDGDARVENDLVRGVATGELTLTGTLAGVGLVGTLTLRDGARASFRGNDFTLKHAVMDFTDRRRLRASLDVQGEALVNDYQILLALSGPYEAPTLQLSSQPALSQRDIVTLLSLGYTTRDTAAAGGASGVATAAAAQALFSASGLDSQVRRFVPRSRLLRDFSVRITSAYSEASGQVEPRAEFESKLLDDRFRLRYQAPIANSRGQRAQAEMRLSPHTALQYQWDSESPDSRSGGDHGVDLKLRWEWSE